jgi:hypothetical protein
MPRRAARNNEYLLYPEKLVGSKADLFEVMVPSLRTGPDESDARTACSLLELYGGNAFSANRSTSRG